MTQAQLFMIGAAERHALAAQNLSTGELRKKRGLKKIAENTEKPWIDRALFLFKVYVEGLGKGAHFAIEDARAFMDVCGLPKPRSHNVWGTLPIQAVAAGIGIRKTERMRKALSPRTHSHPVSLWEVT